MAQHVYSNREAAERALWAHARALHVTLNDVEIRRHGSGYVIVGVGTPHRAPSLWRSTRQMCRLQKH